jgi:hypothetical protein
MFGNNLIDRLIVLGPFRRAAICVFRSDNRTIVA